MVNAFPGFSRKVLGFFRDLERNNDREWFSARKELFEEQIRRPMIQLVELLSGSFRRLAPEYVPDKPEKAIYRIYRDTRFAKDKTPYKTHIGANFQHRRIEKNRGAGYYFEISHRGVGIAGGIYMPGPDEQLAVRQKLERDWKQFKKICEAPALRKSFGELQGEKMARVPKAFSPESPAAEWLKYKQLYVYTELDAKLALSPKLESEILSHFKLLVPLVQFINEAILETLEEEGEDDRPKRPEPMF